MAKKRSTRRRLTRRQIARHEREARAQRLLIGIAIGVGVVVALLLIYGVVTEVFIAARRPVARVDEEPITTKEYRARQSYERWMTELEIYQYQSYLTQIGAQQPLTDTTGTDEDDGTGALIQQLQLTISNLERQLSPDLASVFAGQVLDDMIEEELVRQEAEERDLTVTDEALQERIGLILGYNPESATEAVTDTETATDTLSAVDQPSFDELYRQFEDNVLDVTRYPESDFRAMVRAQLLQEQVAEQLAETVPQEQDQVQTTMLAVDTEEAAEALRTRINEGEEAPADLVEELQNDESDQTSGFELPWLPIGYLGGQFSPEIEQVAFNTPVGRASEPVLGGEGRYYVVYVRGHEERELSEELLAQAEQQAYEGWLAQAKEERVEYLDWEDAIVTD